MKPIEDRIVAGVVLVCLFFVLPDSMSAQDALYQLRDGGRSAKRVIGKITSVTANSVTINGSEVPASQIQKVTFGKAPPEVGKARDQMESGRFSDAIAELAKVRGSADPNVKQEIEFIRAYSTAQLSLRGGNVIPKTAGSAVKNFISSYPNSFHVVPAKEQFAQLAFAAGAPQVAAGEFKKLQSSNWLEYQLKGYFHAGQMHILLGDLELASKNFKAISGVQSNNNLAQTYKLLAVCELAKVDGLRGNTDVAQKKIEQIIKKENSDNKKLFAHLYNALGAVHEKAGRLKEAAHAYLHTELLFAAETDAHAEAVYRLALIWPQLEDTDRANRARTILQERYRNSYWARKL